MNKKLLLLMLSILLLLPGCSYISPDVVVVNPPTLKKTPLDGKWTITKSIFKDTVGENSFEYKNLIGSDVIFSSNGIIFNTNYSDNISYRVKNINVKNMPKKSNYNSILEKLNINTDKVYLITIYKDGKLIYSILKIADEISYVILDDAFLQLTRVSNTITEKEFKDYVDGL